MSEAAKQGDGLVYRDNIAIAWSPAPEELDTTHLAMVNASNEEFLRAVSVIGDVGGLKELPDGSGMAAQELQRLDLKLNLVLDLVSTLIYHQLDIPDPDDVAVSASGVNWAGDVLPASNAMVYLRLYIQRGLPKPLCCYGRVVSGDKAHSSGRCEVEFVGLSGAAKSWLEKLIFRHHRREVAYRRASKN